MPAYMVTYDKRPGANYGPLHDLLRQMGAVSPAESFWLVLALEGAAVLRDRLMTVLSPNDRLIVIEAKIGADWATRHAAEGGGNWLGQFVTPADTVQYGAPTNLMGLPMPRTALGNI